MIRAMYAKRVRDIGTKNKNKRRLNEKLSNDEYEYVIPDVMPPPPPPP